MSQLHSSPTYLQRPTQAFVALGLSNPGQGFLVPGMLGMGGVVHSIIAHCQDKMSKLGATGSGSFHF